METALQQLLGEMNRKLDFLIKERTIKELYTVPEFAEMVGKAEFTVREWARAGRIRAVKRQTGRGKSKDWAIPHAELVRYRNQGLLPLPDQATPTRPSQLQPWTCNSCVERVEGGAHHDCKGGMLTRDGVVLQRRGGNLFRITDLGPGSKPFAQAVNRWIDGVPHFCEESVGLETPETAEKITDCYSTRKAAQQAIAQGAKPRQPLRT